MLINFDLLVFQGLEFVSFSRLHQAQNADNLQVSSRKGILYIN